MKPVENLTLEEIDQKITRTAVEAAIEIGYYLKQIRDRKLYVQAGCKDVYEYADKHYGYDKSVASRHMSRNDRFSVGGNSPELAEKYRGYGKSQPQEMISMTEEQLQQVNPDMTVQEMKNLKRPEKVRKNPELPKEKAVATSQQNRRDSCLPEQSGCIRQEWGFSAEQQEKGRKECETCWNQWQRLHGKEQSIPEEKEPAPLHAALEKEQELSAYGLSALEYPPDSLIAAAGCGEFGGVLYHCSGCHMNNCQIRQKDGYCVEAPMGNPFSCGTLLLMEQEQVRRAVGDHPCQFLDHDLAEHMAGDGSAVPCCKNCDTPCAYQCGRAAVRETLPELKEEEANLREEEPEERIIDGNCCEVDVPLEDDWYNETPEKTNRELAKKMLDKENQTLKLILGAFTEDDEYTRKQKILIAALAGYICGLDIQQNQENRIQPELLRNYKDWGLWYEDENIGVKYYKYDFANGARLIAEVYQEPETKHVPAYESCHLHLVGGPESPKNGFLDKWTRHERYSRHPNSETELVEFLKEVQRNG